MHNSDYNIHTCSTFAEFHFEEFLAYFHGVFFISEQLGDDAGLGCVDGYIDLSKVKVKLMRYRIDDR